MSNQVVWSLHLTVPTQRMMVMLTMLTS